MLENEENMTDANSNDVAKKVLALWEELAVCRTRASEIEEQLSLIDAALANARPKRSVGRPRKSKYAAPVTVEEFDGNEAE